MSLGEQYEAHHRERRNSGDFVFIPERIPLFREAIGEGKHVLDLGCRSGALTRHFLEGNEVVGVDVDEAALAKAEAELGIDVITADVEEPLPLESESFDAVVAGELLEHVRFPEALVSEAHRVLKPGGVFVGSVPNAFRIQNRLRFLLGRQPDKDPTHVHMFTAAEIRALLKDFAAVQITLLGGRFRRLHARLLAQDLFFRAVRPS
jgi:SAM-dependent methyltransferase